MASIPPPCRGIDPIVVSGPSIALAVRMPSFAALRMPQRARERSPRLSVSFLFSVFTLDLPRRVIAFGPRHRHHANSSARRNSRRSLIVFHTLLEVLHKTVHFLRSISDWLEGGPLVSPHLELRDGVDRYPPTRATSFSAARVKGTQLTGLDPSVDSVHFGSELFGEFACGKVSHAVAFTRACSHCRNERIP